MACAYCDQSARTPCVCTRECGTVSSPIGHCPRAVSEEQAETSPEMREFHERRRRLEAEFGKPVMLCSTDALALASTSQPGLSGIKPNDLVAHIYRDKTAADAWLESNREHNGHPTLFRIALPDGRVIGALDLRPAIKRMTRAIEARG